MKEKIDEILRLEEMNKKFDDLRELTRTQDKLQLDITPLNQSIADGLALVDHANAIILESSLWKGNIIPLLEHGYLEEKINALNRDLEIMKKHYEVRTHPVIFENLEFDYGKNQWKLKQVID